jgi:hypothetical protein
MAIKMSEYLCKLVDFAKHGEGISEKEYKDCEKAFADLGDKRWPDFLEKDNN